MTAFIITEDFPKSQVEFDKRFSTQRACYEYLFKLLTGSVRNTFTFAPAVNTSNL
jgi:hypothetical protein